MTSTNSRIGRLAREFAGRLNREARIALTPVPKGKKWLFLVGCYNSGTTLLAQLLGQHPEISALPTEGHFITDEFVKDYEIGLPRMWVDREDLFRLTENDEGPDPIRLKKEWGMRLDLSKPVLLEKSPPNAPRVRWLQANFDDAYFVGILRNPYAVAEGISRKAQPHHVREGWPIEKCAYQWARSNQILEEDSKHLERFTWVRYEDLAASPRSTLDYIAEFVGLQKFADFRDTAEFAVHERNEQIRDMNPESINKLSAADIAAVNRVAADQIEFFGYDKLS